MGLTTSRNIRIFLATAPRLGDGQSLGDFSLDIGCTAVQKSTGAARAEFTGSSQRGMAIFLRNIQPAQRLFRHCAGNYELTFAVVPAEHELRRSVFSVTSFPREDKRASRNELPLAVLETDNSTPYYLNLPYRRRCPHLILGMTRSGSPISAFFLLQNAQKYDRDLHLRYRWQLPVAYDDIQGLVSQCGQEARTLKPSTPSRCSDQRELQFLLQPFSACSLRVRAALPHQLQEERRLWDAIERITYWSEPAHDF